jgi:hypothetical protein
MEGVYEEEKTGGSSREGSQDVGREEGDERGREGKPLERF